ncbi:MAG: sodium:solute symporter [Bacteroidales bacterium]|nr:sodium:solute symporter [Bacteroidales bacterium]
MSYYIVLIVIALYFLMLFSVSYFTARKADNEAFFVGDRKSPWYVVAIAMIGTSISGVTFISVPGWVTTTQFSYLQMVLGFVAGYFVIAFVLIPLYYKLNLMSIYGYLSERFGRNSYKTGSVFFLISKMLGCGVRMYLTAIVLQVVLFDKIEVPFSLNIIVTMIVVWLYTFRGGVKTLVWTDLIQTLSLILAVVLCVFFICKQLGYNFSGLYQTIIDSPNSKIFFFEDSNDKRYFWKQFLAGMFTTIAMTGLDQDMMQKNLSCKNIKDAQKNVISYGVLFLPVNLLFLALGVILYIFAASENITLPLRSDEVFPVLATGNYLPQIVGILFVMGLIAAAFSSAGSALTALTTSFTIDILGANKKGKDLSKTRIWVHVANTIIMGFVIYAFKLLNNTSVIDAVYILASYTYGPLLGIYMFGLITKLNVRDRFVPIVAVLSPVLCYIISANSEKWFNGYQMGYELLLVNAAITFIGMLCLVKKNTTSIIK